MDKILHKKVKKTFNDNNSIEIYQKLENTKCILSSQNKELDDDYECFKDIILCLKRTLGCKPKNEVF